MDVADERLVTALRGALAENRSLRRMLTHDEGMGREPIAVVGIGCRFGGEVSSAEQLWEVVEQGRDTICDFPADRGWDLHALYDAQPGVPRRSYVREGGFLDDAPGFDAAFFGISPREATAMDPQQRILLEVTWEALEHAGIDPRSLRDTNTGIYAGVAGADYGSRFANCPPGFEGHVGEGNSASVLSGRIAYVLGLRGPAMSVDTACSSSLVTLHLGMRALRAGECSLALTGGVTVMATPTTFLEFCALRGLAPDGRCKGFADRADGFALAEGAGVLVLERLADARRNGHRVLAVVRGSSVNADGASNGLTAPSGAAQTQVIRAAWADAGVIGSWVDLIEAHGTGTPLGDPIEANALLATYGQDRSQPVWLGSVKSNLGHTQAAAGVAGVIKAIGALRCAVLPATLHVDSPTNKVDWTAGSVRLLQKNRPWPDPGRPRRAAVSSFGISGTNAHVILEEAPPARVAETAAAPVLAWVLSARSAVALTERARNLGDFLAKRPEVNAGEVASALVRRAVFEHRAVVVGADRSELDRGLAALISGEKAVPSGRAGTGRTIFVFPGQGSQWIGMGRELHAAFPVFAEAFDAAAKACDEDLPRALCDVVWGQDSAALDDTLYAQPALFAIEVGLTALVRSFGVHPDIAFGHSLGEITAAHVAGALTLPDAAALVTARARLMSALPAGGVMIAVAAPPAAVAPLLTSGVDLAAVNGPDSVVISGVEAKVVAVATALAERGRRTKRLKVSHAFHSELIEPALDELARVTATISTTDPSLPIVSNVDGRLVSSSYAVGDYWVRHAREPVRFGDSVATVLAEDPDAVFIEVGPGTVLSGLLQQASATAIPLLRAGGSEVRTVADALAARFIAGGSVDWLPLLGRGPVPDLDLPTYPFTHKRFWLESLPPLGDVRAFGAQPTRHPLLTAALPDPLRGGMTLTGRLSLDTHPWMADHRIGGAVVVPGAAMVEWALTAGALVGLGEVCELILKAPLVLPEHGGMTVQAVVGGADDGGQPIAILSRSEDSDGLWTRHAEGTLVAARPRVGDCPWSVADAEPIDLTDAYDRAAAAGYQYGPAFRGLIAAWRSADEVLAEVELPDPVRDQAERFSVHPALLDAALQAMALLGVGVAQGQLLVPFAWERLELARAGARRARAQISAAGKHRVSVTLTDLDGGLIARIGALALRPIAATALGTKHPGTLHHLDWTAVQVGPDTVPHTVLNFDRLWDNRPESLHNTLWRAVEKIRAHLDQDTTLVVVTRGAVGMGTTNRVDLTAAALWGLLRSAQREHPGRIFLVDTDGDTLPDGLGALAAAGEEQLIIRGGQVLAARLVPSPPPTESRQRLDLAGGTVLVTGGTGTVGAALARYLVTEHGASRLLLLSRSGGDAARLDGLSAQTDVVACDVADRDALAAVLAAIPADAPLRGVVHAAGVVDDALFSDLTRDQFDTVLHAKADGAWHLHELTRDQDLAMFVLCSSLAATVGSPGQANYAAANAFLDGLAEHRRLLGLPAQSVAWGLWEATTGMAAALSDEARARLTRLGVRPMREQAALKRFAAVLAGGRVHSVAADVNTEAPAGQSARTKGLTVLRGLGPVATSAIRESDKEPDLITELANLPVSEYTARVREVVYGELAAALGYSDVAEIDPLARFEDLGFDSLTAMEFRNGLTAVTGMRMPPTVAFDYATPAELVDFVVHKLQTLLDSGELASAERKDR